VVLPITSNTKLNREVYLYTSVAHKSPINYQKIFASILRKYRKYAACNLKKIKEKFDKRFKT